MEDQSIDEAVRHLVGIVYVKFICLLSLSGSMDHLAISISIFNF